MGSVLALLLLAGGIIAALWIPLYYKYYRRATADVAFVRTGHGGSRVILGGGAPVYPWRHQITWVYLGTNKLDIRRANREALITKDRFRVDVAADFYVRVPPSEESVLLSAQSLGERTMNPEALKALLEEELVGALRAVAASKTLDELHTDRKGFEQAVLEMLRDPLAQRGLSLERVSLSYLDQTAVDWYDPNNVFDAVGLEQITRQTTSSRTARNDYERAAEVAITQRNVEAHKTILSLEQEKAFADHNQKSAIEEHQAEAQSKTRQFIHQQEEAERKSAIARDMRVREYEIQSERDIRAQELEREAYLIMKELEKERTQIDKDRELNIALWEKERAINAARRVTSVELSEHEMMMFQKMTARLRAEAEVKRAEQEVITTEQETSAQRERTLALIKALEKLEVARHEAEATERIAEAIRKDGQARAEARRLMVEAENSTHDKFILKDILLNLIQQAPAIAKELMEPARQIESIKILDLNAPSLSGATGVSANGPSSEMGSIIEKVLGAVIGSGAVLPLVRELLQFSGYDRDKLFQLVKEKLPTLESLVKANEGEER